MCAVCVCCWAKCVLSPLLWLRLSSSYYLLLLLLGICCANDRALSQHSHCITSSSLHANCIMCTSPSFISHQPSHIMEEETRECILRRRKEGDPVAPAAGKWKTAKVLTDEGGRERRRKGCEGKRVREIHLRSVTDARRQGYQKACA